jgi:single-stranded DNA-binding protein
LTLLSLVLVEGRLRTSSWTTEGVKRSRTDIVAARLQFGPKRLELSRDTDDLPEEDTTPADTADDPHDDIPF